MRAWIGSLTALCLAGTLCGCGFPMDEGRGEGPGGRRQPLAMSPQQEYAVGRDAYAEVMHGFRGRVMPPGDPMVIRCSRIVGRLAKAAAIEPLQDEINLRVRGYRFGWEVNVVRDSQINAFCLPAGKMVVFTGLMRLVGDNDDYLATVLSHEMAHALAHHGSEKVAVEKTQQGILASLSYGRMQEEEADHIGIFLMAFAEPPFDVDAAAAFWGRMRKAHEQGFRMPEFLSDHPSDARRQARLREWAPKARAAREALREGRVIRRRGG
jgi:predicted Zn-dependent protease